MSDSEIPPSILKRHPELVQILEALEAHREDRPITSTCPTCRNQLKVTDVKELGVRTVTCGNGCTNYREKFKP
jgi:hypothetical protein